MNKKGLDTPESILSRDGFKYFQKTKQLKQLAPALGEALLITWDIEEAVKLIHGGMHAYSGKGCSCKYKSMKNIMDCTRDHFLKNIPPIDWGACCKEYTPESFFDDLHKCRKFRNKVIHSLWSKQEKELLRTIYQTDNLCKNHEVEFSQFLKRLKGFSGGTCTHISYNLKVILIKMTNL